MSEYPARTREEKIAAAQADFDRAVTAKNAAWVRLKDVVAHAEDDTELEQDILRGIDVELRLNGNIDVLRILAQRIEDRSVARAVSIVSDDAELRMESHRSRYHKAESE